MTYWYEGRNHVVAGVGVSMVGGDTLYVRSGVAVGSNTNAFGVQATGSVNAQIFGIVLSAGGVGFDADGSDDLITIGSTGQVTSGGDFAMRLEGGYDYRLVNDGTISGTTGGLFVDGNTIGGEFQTRIDNSGVISTATGPAVSMVDGTLINSGVIESAGGAAIEFGQREIETAFIDNSGTISGEIVVDSSMADITNTGQIHGVLDLSLASASTYDGSLGTITGEIFGSFQDDTLLAGAGRDVIAGGQGSDTIEGGAGRDTFVYLNVGNSNGTSLDTVLGFDAHKDKFQMSATVTGIDATVTTGELRTAHFTNDLVGAVGKTALAAHHAVLFTPTSGDYVGDTMLGVDANGKTGYQANADYVIDLSDAANLDTLSVHDFTVI